MSVGQLATVVVLATAMPLLFLAVVMLSQMSDNARQTARDNLVSNARTLAALVDSEIDSHLAVAGTLATSDALQRHDLAAFALRAEQALKLVNGAWLNVWDPSGAVVFSTLRSLPAPLQQPSPAPILFVLSTAKAQLYDLMEDPVTKRLAASIAVPVFKDGAPIYAIAIAINSDRLLNLLENKFTGNPAIGVLDRQQRFLARVPDHQQRLGTLAADSWRAVIARSREGVYETITLEGIPSYTAYTTTREGWIAGISLPTHVVGAAATHILWTMLALGGATVAVSAALGLMLSRRLAHVMGNLAATARLVGSGVIVEAQSHRIIEADAIGAALSSTSKDLSTRTAQLKRAHDTFFNLVQHAPFGVYLVDSQFRISHISTGALPAFRNVNPVLGRDFGDAMKILWPEPFASEAISRFRHTLATGEPYHQSSLEDTRHDTGQQEAYDWQIERITLPNGEFGVVCYYYDLTRQRQAEADLRASELRFRGTFENAAVGVAHVGLDRRFTMVNGRLCALLGYARDELEGHSFEEFTYREDLAADLNNLAKLAAGECASYTMDKRFVRKDGTIVWTGLTVSSQHDAAGETIYYIKILRDITERKQLQAHQQLLLRELVHRLKNQLAVILALTGQTARRAGSLAEFQQMFTQRIQGLAIATDVLVSQNWTGAPLRELVKMQLSAFVPAPERLSCKGPAIVITPDATEAIGLALHELATNCVKYGAWSVPGGVVTVSWNVDATSGKETSLHLAWQESGGPTVTPPTRKGFGHIVIERMAADKVGGSAQLVFTEAGLKWTLTVPMAHFHRSASAEERAHPELAG